MSVTRLGLLGLLTLLTSTAHAGEPTPRAPNDRAALATHYRQSCEAPPADHALGPRPNGGFIGGAGSGLVFDCPGEQWECQRRCTTSADACQDRCADTCGDCKAACAPGDEACLTTCADARASCHLVCEDGARDCRDSQCTVALNECYAAGKGRLEACGADACNAFAACLADRPSADAKARAAATRACAKQARLSDRFCQGYCEAGFSVLEGVPTPALELAPNPDLAARCTPAASCPADYAEVAPFLAGLCAGALGDASIGVLRTRVEAGRVSKASLSLLFNALGAMHHHKFKKEVALNAFFYGTGEWLPASCRGVIGIWPNAGKVPFTVTRARDAIKKLWKATP